MIIATRKLTCKNTKSSVWLRIYKPEQAKGNRSSPQWRCKYSITGAGLNIIRTIIGRDGFNAFYRAIQSIQTDLDETGMPLTDFDDIADVSMQGILNHLNEIIDAGLPMVIQIKPKDLKKMNQAIMCASNELTWGHKG